WTGPDTLVLCSSYSGDTEETLACWEAARTIGAPRVALTTGGALAEAARSDGAPVIGVPAGLQPRAAVAYMTVGALECAALCGAAPSLRSEIEASRDLLDELAGEWGPEGPEESEPKEVARRLRGAVAVVYGAGATAPVARRWKTQLNENAKVPAFFSEVPEANHNEVAGLDGGAELAPLHPILLHEASGGERVGHRLMLTAMLASNAGLRADGLTARGESLTEQVLSLVLCGDLVSLYLAALRGVDPAPVAAIEDLKRRLDE
ncbi:MAG TPA: bifunctional phosphoglucose/phosphomannose isomerase, partial [Thermoleophilaceae bacterium]|nr:bifunctional phosphoglucose/phosphomannose isomerase [Thermoleophilaceae bacterium]